jgi:signal transduction histidine kinase
VARPGSIYYRLIVPFGLTIIVAMLAAWAIAVYLTSRVFEQRVDDQLDHATAILAQGEFPFSSELISRLDRLIEARIALFDESGSVRLTTAEGSTLDALSRVGTAVTAAASPGLLLLSEEEDGAGWRIAIRPLDSDRDRRYRFVAAAASMQEPRRATRDAAAWLGLAMLAATAILAAFGALFARGITRPLGELAMMAGRIAGGERELSIAYAKADEIGVLANALNDMSGRLSTYEADLARQSHLAGLGDLAARLAHEIRNPLTAIKMQLQLLEQTTAGAEAQRVAAVLKEIRRMELIVESALTLGADLTVESRRVDVAAVAGEVVELMAPSLAHRKIDLECQIGEGIDVIADPDRLKQVLLNLINNAADELATGGRIRLSTGSEQAGFVGLCIEDSGPGLDAGTRSADKPFGLGIGLRISREITELMGGELLAGSSAALGGAAFTIKLRLPIMEGPEEP